LELFSVDGRRARVVFEGTLPAGEHTFPIDGPRGAYVAVARAGSSVRSSVLVVAHR
jgi:hypothetical protein